MDVSVAICTWNRADILNQTLTQMRGLSLPNGVNWELLVVNNNCTDHTDEVIARHTDALPIRRLYESQPGHSNARNCAIDRAQGELLIWTDDDVLVDPNWISEYVKVAQAYPDAAYFGGTIDPWFESQPAPWILRHLEELQGPFAIRQLGAETRKFSSREGPFGANMAHRLAILRKVRFDPMRGRVGTELLHGDDEQVNRQLIAAGCYGVWIGSARVRHLIPVNRLSEGYLWRFYAGAGRTGVRLGSYDEFPKLLGVPRYHLKQLCLTYPMAVALSGSRNRRWLQAFKSSAIAYGVIHEFRLRKKQG